MNEITYGDITGYDDAEVIDNEPTEVKDNDEQHIRQT